MIIWISLAIFAQLINAAIVLVDKYVLLSDRGIGKPAVYAFSVSVLSGFVVLMIPFGLVSWPSDGVIVLSFLSAFSFLISIFFLYSALKVTDASDVAPVTGAVSAISALGLSYFVLHQDLPPSFGAAFAFLVAGTLLISHFRFDSRSFAYTFISGMAFGVSAVLLKLIFQETDFLNGFFWSRIANVFVALGLLLIPAHYEMIRNTIKRTSFKTRYLVIGNKTLGGVAFVIFLLGQKLGSVSIVNALSGLQFVFILGFAYISTKMFPVVFRGEIHPHRFNHKLYGIIFILFGLIALFIQ